MPRQLVIWDFDGTLVNSFPLTFTAIRAGVEPSLKRSITDQEIASYFGRPDDEIVRLIVGEDRYPEAFQRMLDEITRRIELLVVYEGVLDAVAEFNRLGYAQAVFTGRGSRSTNLMMEHLGLRSRFLRILTGNDVTRPKPDPEGFRKLCSELGVEGASTIALGDTVADVRAGQAIGALTVGCAWDAFCRREELVEAGASVIVDHPSQITPLMRGKRPGAGR